MATKYTCDLCGKSIPNDTSSAQKRHPNILRFISEDAGAIIVTSYDLCHECEDTIKQTIAKMKRLDTLIVFGEEKK